MKKKRDVLKWKTDEWKAEQTIWGRDLLVLTDASANYAIFYVLP